VPVILSPGRASDPTDAPVGPRRRGVGPELWEAPVAGHRWVRERQRVRGCRYPAAWSRLTARGARRTVSGPGDGA